MWNNETYFLWGRTSLKRIQSLREKSPTHRAQKEPLSSGGDTESQVKDISSTLLSEFSFFYNTYFVENNPRSVCSGSLKSSK